MGAASEQDASITPTSPCWLHLLQPHHHHNITLNPFLLPSPPSFSSSSSSPSPVPGGFNYTVSEEDLRRGRVIIALAIVRLCLATLGCAANLIAAVVLTNRKLWSPTSMLLLSLVIYDACYLLLVIPVAATSISINLEFTPEKYSTLRTIIALCFPLRYMAQMCSTYTTLTVTLERFLVILLPLRASSMWTYGKTRRAIIGLLLFSVLFNLPRCFDHILTKPRSSSRSSASPITASPNGEDLSPPTNLSLLAGAGDLPDDSDWESAYMGLVSSRRGIGNDVSGTGNVSCVNEGLMSGKGGSGDQQQQQPSPAEAEGTFTPEEDEGGVSEEVVYYYKVVYQFYITAIFLYLIPYTLIPVLNFLLVIALRRRRDESRRLSVKNEHRMNWTRSRHSVPTKTDKEEGLTYIVFGITLCYFICCILPTVYMVFAIATGDTTNPTAIFIFNAGETTLVINAATDFFFYCLLGRKFRRVFVRMFCARRYVLKMDISLQETCRSRTVRYVDLSERRGHSSRFCEGLC